ncbi:MAG: hypothetical protein LBL72_01565 [Candidatus Accumulibacter sp.]|jgi:hypothetical protein|nr:hypothetical protein [Accumulibacter sp.]
MPWNSRRIDFIEHFPPPGSLGFSTPPLRHKQDTARRALGIIRRRRTWIEGLRADMVHFQAFCTNRVQKASALPHFGYKAESGHAFGKHRPDFGGGIKPTIRF